MAFLHVRTDRCIHCGRCSEECVSGAVVMGANGPEAAHEVCIACGHCVAVCPTAALENGRCSPAPSFPQGWAGLDPAVAETFLRSRHSERCFLPKPVPRELIAEMLRLARYAPTGGNIQGMRFLAIDRRDILDAIIAAVFAWGREEQGKGSRLGQLMANFEARYAREGRDTVLWGAPCLVIALPQPGRPIPSPRDSAVFSLLYAQLYATSLKLGTCWAGLVEAAAWSRHPDLAGILRPLGAENLAGAIMAGFPKHAYHRLTEREELDLRWP